MGTAQKVAQKRTQVIEMIESRNKVRAAGATRSGLRRPFRPDRRESARTGSRGSGLGDMPQRAPLNILHPKAFGIVGRLERSPRAEPHPGHLDLEATALNELGRHRLTAAFDIAET